MAETANIYLFRIIAISSNENAIAYHLFNFVSHPITIALDHGPLWAQDARSMNFAGLERTEFDPQRSRHTS